MGKLVWDLLATGSSRKDWKIHVNNSQIFSFAQQAKACCNCFCIMQLLKETRGSIPIPISWCLIEHTWYSFTLYNLVPEDDAITVKTTFVAVIACPSALKSRVKPTNVCCNSCR